MVSREVITAALIGLAVTGVIPVIAGLVLLAVHKIKASSFWAGVLAYVIAFVAYTILSGILSVVMMASSGLDMTSMMTAATESNSSVSIIVTICLGIVLAIAMGICVSGCMKTRTFNAALSCGLGFGAGYLVTAAINFYSSYSTFSKINSGEFDKIYSTMVSQGFMDKETVNKLKETVTSQTSGDMIISIVSSVAVALLMAAAAVIIMRGVCAKKAFAGIGVSLILFAAQFGLSGFIPNAAAAVIVSLAIGAAALIFAVRMKKDIVPPEKPSYSNDSFMQSIENAKSETDVK
ncbi:MAG: hypothetical protein K2J73_09675 [Oscillospiraceae bacterium]|nr:hypothetical protein [Oscillospiraceae bacterium]